MQIVAEYQGKVTPDIFANILCDAGKEYGSCLVVVENNSVGFAVLEKLKDMESRLPNGELKEIQEDLRDIKEILLDPEDGLVVRVNKNTYWRKKVNPDDIKDLKSFKSTVTHAVWVVYIAVIGLFSKIIWGD